MVICKYFQQGTCRFGQYCKFEHSFGNRTKTFGGDDKNLALQVAEEVLLAERGGQWLLSCYGPFKERKSIPGMEDVSPEEVRWEMYQAQKSGTVEQIKAQFQQMCEEMRAKRDALKNPSQAVAQLLEEIQNSGTDNSANKGNFVFGQPQMSASNQTSSVFGQKTAFGPQSNPFGGTFNSPQQSSSIFGKPAANTSTNVFGTKSSFGSSPMFGGGATTTGNSIFGGTQNAAPFGTAKVQPMFAAMQPQTSSIFGGATASQSTFGQPPAFGGAQTASPFLKPQTTTQTSVFGGPATTAVTPGTNAASIFGGGVATAQPAVVPGGAPAGGIFGQAAATAGGAAAFGGAPVFGTPVGFGATQPGAGGSVFGGQSVFGGATAAAAVPSAAATPGNVFGGASTGASSFGVLAQNVNTAGGFGGVTTTTGGANVFETAPNASPFGAPIPTAASPFGGMNTAGNSVFASSAPTSTAATGPFGATMTPFSAAPTSTFGFATSAPNTVTNVFGATTTVASQSPFGGNTFVSGGGTAVTNSPFAPKTQQATGSPFGPLPTQQSSSFSIFGKSSISMTVAIIDETGYSPEDGLTDDEKAAYRANQFPEGHIPLRPPTKVLR